MAKTTAQVVTDLLTRRDAILTELAEMTAGSVGALPNTSGTGDHVDNVGHRQSLYAELKNIRDTLEMLGEATESHSRGRLT